MEKVLIELGVKRQRKFLGQNEKGIDSGLGNILSKKSRRRKYKIYSKGLVGVDSVE